MKSLFISILLLSAFSAFASDACKTSICQIQTRGSEKDCIDGSRSCEYFPGTDEIKRSTCKCTYGTYDSRYIVLLRDDEVVRRYSKDQTDQAKRDAEKLAQANACVFLD